MLVMRPLVLTTANRPIYETEKVLEVEIDDGKPWYHDIRRYLEHGEFPEGAGRKDRLAIQKLASQYVILKEELYKRQANGIQLKCLRKEEAQKVMEEVHAGVCGPHMNGLNLSRKIVRQRFYWSTMEADCTRMVKHCHDCQVHGNLSHLPHTELHGLSEPWLFSAWGIDMIGEI